MMLQSIIGTWTLDQFFLQKGEEKRAWGNQTHGQLLYSPTGHMSVSINKTIENDPEQSDLENLFDSILFYSGTYTLEGDVIRHQVKNASNPGRIGKELIRYAKLEGDLLTLTSPEESFGRAVLVWRRV